MIPGYDWLANLTDIVNNLVTTKGAILVADGQLLLAAVGVIELGLLIIRYLRNDGGSAIELLADAVMLLLGVCILSTMLSFWMIPIPGTSISIHQIPGDVAKHLTGVFDREIFGRLQDHINAVLDPKTGVQKPSSILDMLNVGIYMQVLGAMTLMQCAMFCITAFGFMAQGLIVLFMPLLIPTIITKHFSHWFWGTLDCLVVFSMYRAVSAGVGFVWASMITTFFENSLNGAYSLGTFLAVLPTMWLLTVTFVLCAFMVPSMTSKMFGGAGQAGQAFASDARAAVVSAIMFAA